MTTVENLRDVILQGRMDYFWWVFNLGLIESLSILYSQYVIVETFQGEIVIRNNQLPGNIFYVHAFHPMANGRQYESPFPITHFVPVKDNRNEQL